MIAVGTAEELRRLEALARNATPLSAEALARLSASSGSSSSGRRAAITGDYATNAALQLAPERKQPPREIAEEWSPSGGAGGRGARRDRRPGFVNLWLSPAWYGKRWARFLTQATLRSGVRGEASGCRSRWFRRTRRADHGRLGTERATAIRGPAPRVPGTRGARVLLQRRGAQMDSSASPSRRAPREEPPEGRLFRGLRRRVARTPVIPCRACGSNRGHARAFSNPFDSWALQSDLEQGVSELPRASRPTSRKARSGSPPEVRDKKDRVVVRSAERGAYRPMRRRHCVPRRQARARVRPGNLRAGADHHGSAVVPVVARMLGYEPEPDRGADLPARAPDRARATEEVVETTWGRRLPRGTYGRGRCGRSQGYLVSRGPDQTIDIDVDLAAEKSQKNPVLYVSTRTRASPAPRNAEGAEVSASRPPTWPSRSES